MGYFLNALTVVKHLISVRRFCRASPEQIKSHQLKKLKELARYAYARVPFYREKWDRAGVGLDDIETLEDLKKLPVITKEDLRLFCPDSLKTNKYSEDKGRVLRTTGSTGNSACIRWDAQKCLAELAAMSYSAVGLYAGLPLKKHGMAVFVTVDDAVESLAFWAFPRQAKERVISVFEPVDKQIAMLNRIKPSYLISYPSALRNMAAVVQNTGQSIHQPKLILTTGECVDSLTRKALQSVFHGEVRDVYGATEAGVAAFECSQGKGLHVLSFKAVVEVIDDNGRAAPPGETGHVVVTDLLNKAMPMIRYKGLGDLCSFSVERCSCQLSHFPLLNQVEGRTIDALVMPDKRIVHPYQLTLAMQDLFVVKKFQIQQKAINDFRVLIVKDNSPEAQTLTMCDAIQERFKNILGPEAQIEIQTVSDIPPRKGSHKHAAVMSWVQA